MNTKKIKIEFNTHLLDIYIINEEHPVISIPDLFLSFKLEDKDEMEIISYLFNVMDEKDAEHFAHVILKELGEDNGI